MNNPKKHYMTYYSFKQMYPSEQEYIKLHKKYYYSKCPYCGEKSRLYISTRRPRIVHCNKCKREFSIFRKTIIKNTKIDLRKWGYVYNYVYEYEPNITACKLMGKIKVSYKTAWRMLKLIRNKKAKKNDSKES